MRPSETEISTFVMYFGGSLRGLSPGAPVELQGITVGEVKSLDVEYNERTQLLAFPVAVELYPQRLRGRAGRAAAAEHPHPQGNTHALIDSLVAHGLRAELKTGNLLTGQKFVSLEMHRDVAKTKVAWNEQPAIFPTVSGSLDDIQDSVGVIAKKLSKVPFDQLSARLLSAMNSLDATLKSADQLLHNVDGNLAPQIQKTLAEAEGALKNAKDLLGQNAPLENDLGSTLLQVSRAAKSIGALVDYLERHPESLLRGKPAGSP